jgi:hypothetical protein
VIDASRSHTDHATHAEPVVQARLLAEALDVFGPAHDVEAQAMAGPGHGAGVTLQLIRARRAPCAA